MNDTTKPEVKLDASSILAKAKASIEGSDNAPPEVEAPDTVVQTVVVPSEGAVYQQYSSARTSTCLITPTGKRINFTSYQYYTKDPEIIAYLDKAIKDGLRGFTKGKKLTAEELNPEAAKKREIIEEFKASQEGREFGNTKAVEARTTALSSGQVAR